MSLEEAMDIVMGDSADADDGVDEEILSMTPADIDTRTRLINSEIIFFENEVTRLKREADTLSSTVTGNAEKVKMNKQLPWLVSTVVEV
jgi:26S proteasome regulatory subunit T5